MVFRYRKLSCFSLQLHPLQAAVEDLREWFASDVLQPLQRAIESAHSDVIDSAAQIGLPPSISLTALSELGTGRKSNADDSLKLAQIRGHVEEYLRNPANQGSVQLLKCKHVKKNFMLGNPLPLRILLNPKSTHLILSVFRPQSRIKNYYCCYEVNLLLDYCRLLLTATSWKD